MASVRSPSPAGSVAGRQRQMAAPAQQDFPVGAGERDDLKIEKFTRERAKLGYYLL
jgi:hypothetical protein